MYISAVNFSCSNSCQCSCCSAVHQ